jgi:ribosomal protein L37AE/L43A
MKEVDWDTPIQKAEFIFKREFMIMEHNYLCAVCKEKSGVQETNTGILQPCWECQNKYKVVKLTWVDKLLGRVK